MIENTIGIIGKSNTGKTRKILFNEVDEQIKQGNSLLILDSKLEYYNNYAENLLNNGYKIKVVNFKEPLLSDGYDPINYLQYLYNNNKLDSAISLIKNMGLTLFSSSNNSDPFWSNSAADYFTGIVLTLLRIGKDKANFPSISNIINQGEKEYKGKSIIRAYCDSLDIMDPSYITLSTTVYAPNDTKGSIISVAKEKLNNIFMRPELLKSFENSTFHVEQIENKEKLALFIINNKETSKLTNILIEQVYHRIINNNIFMTFILDDFDELDSLSSIEDIINKANNKKLKLYATARNIDHLMSLYKKYTLTNIEKEITLTDKIDLPINNKTYPLPKLTNHNTKYFNFEEYVKKDLQ